MNKCWQIKYCKSPFIHEVFIFRYFPELSAICKNKNLMKICVLVLDSSTFFKLLDMTNIKDFLKQNMFRGFTVYNDFQPELITATLLLGCEYS